MNLENNLYGIRWSNGFHKIYSYATYKDVAMYGTRKEAEASLANELKRLEEMKHGY